MRICSSSGMAEGQKIININVTSFYLQTAESRKFRLHIVQLFFKAFSFLVIFLFESCDQGHPLGIRPDIIMLVLSLDNTQEKLGYD